MLKPAHTSFTLSDLAEFEDDSPLAEIAPNVEVQALVYYEVESASDSHVDIIANYETNGFDVNEDSREEFWVAVKGYGESTFYNVVGEGMYYEHTDTPARSYSILDAAVDLRMIDDSTVYQLLVERDELGDAVHALLREARGDDADLLFLLTALDQPEVDEILARSSKFRTGLQTALERGVDSPVDWRHVRRIAELSGDQNLSNLLSEKVVDTAGPLATDGSLE